MEQNPARASQRAISENNRDTSDLSRHRAHYDVIVMSHLPDILAYLLSSQFCFSSLHPCVFGKLLFFINLSSVINVIYDVL